MAYHIWRVGLDIQNGVVRALAVQRRRDGWQLRHWWQLPLPSDTLRAGSLHDPDSLCEVLHQWRRELPRFISLRIALPPALIFQQRMAAPDSRLREPERSGYIEKMASRTLPVSRDALALDYRDDPHTPDTVLVTAARKTALTAWLSCLARAGLYADVVDISPCALRCVARQVGISPHAPLLHRFEDSWLWISPVGQPLHFGTFTSQDSGEHATPLDYIREIDERFPASAHYPVYLSSSVPNTDIGDVERLIPWSPLAAFSYQQPPLPTEPSTFAIAAGLALRPGDE